MKLIIALFFLLTSLASKASSLSELTDIVKKAPSMQAFIYDQGLLDEYFIALNKYYQDKIIKEEFLKTIEQIKFLAKKRPDFFVRLEKAPEFSSYAIEVDSKSYGRNVHNVRFSQFLMQEKMRLNEFSIDFKNEEEALLYVKEFQDKEFDMLDSLAGLKAKEQKKISASFYIEAKKDVRLKNALSKLLAELFWNTSIAQEMMTSKDADFIFLSFEELIPITLIDHYALPRSLLSFIKKLLPTTESLLLREDLFSHQLKESHNKDMVKVGVTRRGRYEFRSFDLPFHSIWKNYCLKECVRDNPKRWAIPLLSGVQSYAIERNGHYIGYLQEIPVSKSGKRIVYATEFGTELFRSNVFIKRGKQYEKITFYDLWLMQVQHQYVRVKSEADLIDNAEVTSEFIFRSSKNNLNVKLGENQEFKILDQEFADFLVREANEPQSKTEMGIKSNASIGITFELINEPGYAEARVFPLFIAKEEQLQNVKRSAQRKVLPNKKRVPIAELGCNALMQNFL
ncbi:MAG: hypothetical protein KBD76_06250 [Bacteriovorax sp.]|jgi:hypothetical protein|nr:hypothetical protein [Bacteriovorax sp.]